MGKKTYCVMLLAICLALAVNCSRAYAVEVSVRSRGNIRFESREGEILLCGEDMDYLLEKVSSIPDEMFDPAYYSHIHIWKYGQIDSSTHTKQCTICSKSVTKSHVSRRQEPSVIIYRGGSFSGTMHTCECGQEWLKETAHNLVYVQKDEEGHIVRCELSNTDYCSGRDETEEEHSYSLESGEDYRTHFKTCRLCGFKKEEECGFDSYSEKTKI